MKMSEDFLSFNTSSLTIMYLYLYVSVEGKISATSTGSDLSAFIWLIVDFLFLAADFDL